MIPGIPGTPGILCSTPSTLCSIPVIPGTLCNTPSTLCSIPGIPGTLCSTPSMMTPVIPGIPGIPSKVILRDPPPGPHPGPSLRPGVPSGRRQRGPRGHGALPPNVQPRPSQYPPRHGLHRLLVLPATPQPYPVATSLLAPQDPWSLGGRRPRGAGAGSHPRVPTYPLRGRIGRRADSGLITGSELSRDAQVETTLGTAQRRALIC